MINKKTICATVALMMALLYPLKVPAEQHPAEVPAKQDEDQGEAFLFGFLTAINIPSRLILCGLDVGMGGLVMGLSAGRRQDDAAGIIREGCAGPWIIEPDGAPMAEKKDDLVQKYQAVLEESERLRRESELKEQEIARLNVLHEELVRALREEIETGKAEIMRTENLLAVRLLARILFDTGKAEITPEGVEVLSRLGGILTSVEDREIRVEGHTDDVPITGGLSTLYPTNWELSTARATAVVHYLRDQLQLPPEKLSATGFGEHRPVASNDMPEGRAQNRRIEVILAPFTVSSVR